MAVYTKINKKDIVSINDQFGIEKIIHFKGIKKGIENTNYLLKTKKNKFILQQFYLMKFDFFHSFNFDLKFL